MKAYQDIRCIESLIAAASFLVAAALAFTALLLSPDNEIEAGVCMVIAQFLLLCASALHIDFKLHRYGKSSLGSAKQ